MPPCFGRGLARGVKGAVNVFGLRGLQHHGVRGLRGFPANNREVAVPTEGLTVAGYPDGLQAVWRGARRGRWGSRGLVGWASAAKGCVVQAFLVAGSGWGDLLA